MNEPPTPASRFFGQRCLVDGAGGTLDFVDERIFSAANHGEAAQWVSERDDVLGRTARGDSFHVVRCRQCGTIQLFWQPSRDGPPLSAADIREGVAVLQRAERARRLEEQRMLVDDEPKLADRRATLAVMLLEAGRDADAHTEALIAKTDAESELRTMPKSVTATEALATATRVLSATPVAFTLLFADVNTGILLARDGAWAIKRNPHYEFFASLDDAKALAVKTIAEHPTREAFIWDESGRVVHQERDPAGNARANDAARRR
jgi:hypothetical protein